MMQQINNIPELAIVNCYRQNALEKNLSILIVVIVVYYDVQKFLYKKALVE